MTRQIDPREADMVVAELRAANPVRRRAGHRRQTRSTHSFSRDGKDRHGSGHS